MNLSAVHSGIVILLPLRRGVFSKENWYMSLKVEPYIAWQAGSDLHTKCCVTMSRTTDTSKCAYYRGEVDSC